MNPTVTAVIAVAAAWIRRLICSCSCRILRIAALRLSLIHIFERLTVADELGGEDILGEVHRVIGLLGGVVAHVDIVLLLSLIHIYRKGE